MRIPDKNNFINEKLGTNAGSLIRRDIRVVVTFTINEAIENWIPKGNYG